MEGVDMRLRQLLATLPPGSLRDEGPPSPDPEIVGVTHDSRRVRPGDLFVAVPGERHDGRRFWPQAVERGAVAVLGRGEPPADLPVPWLAAAEPRQLLGPLAAEVYEHPDRHLLTCGVTGTNGKSTVISLLASILRAAGQRPGMIGTLGYVFEGRELGTGRTTPEATDLFRILAEMHGAGADAAVMEVSSHALDLGRVAGMGFDTAVFTHLSRDHLDFHGTMEAYFQAKRRLFQQLKPAGRAAVSVDDPYGRRLAAELSDAVTFGNAGEVRCLAADLTLEGIGAEIELAGVDIEFRSPLIGRYNLKNLMAAAAAGVALGLAPRTICQGLESATPLPGRLERLTSVTALPVFIDYAHTPGALEAALTSVAELSERPLIVVFGCGGDRDRGKRAPMGRIAGQLADLAIATSDNPRSESPHDILKTVQEGLATATGDYRLEPDRRAAIRLALEEGARRGAVVLIAGRGHETHQLVGGRRIPFSDLEETAAAAAELGLGEGGDG